VKSHPLLVPSPGSPAALGYRFPAEWEPHAATWLAWPHNPATWPGKFEPIPTVWQKLVRTLARFEPVNIFAGGEAVRRQAESLVGDVPQVTLHDIPTNDVWTRDHGPMFLAGPPGLPPSLVDWDYNAWGGKYPPFDLDNEIPRQVAELTGRRRFVPGIILEGGAVDGNGAGTILTTEQCLLNPNRNPHLGRLEVERHLADYCAARKVIWLGGGIVGDDTDGHIDDLTRFTDATTLVTLMEDDPADENHALLLENRKRLDAMRDPSGQPWRIVELPTPGRIERDGQRLPASYANFYVANGVVLMPGFGHPNDARAQAILQDLFPTRRVIVWPSLDLIWGLGALHCITQQQPAAR
jgi:agmatine deiminase